MHVPLKTACEIIGCEMSSCLYWNHKNVPQVNITKKKNKKHTHKYNEKRHINHLHCAITTTTFTLISINATELEERMHFCLLSIRALRSVVVVVVITFDAVQSNWTVNVLEFAHNLNSGIKRKWVLVRATNTKQAMHSHTHIHTCTQRMFFAQVRLMYLHLCAATCCKNVTLLHYAFCLQQKSNGLRKGTKTLKNT